MEFAKFIQELTENEEKFTMEVDEDNEEITVEVETASGSVVTFTFDDEGDPIGVAMNDFQLSL